MKQFVCFIKIYHQDLLAEFIKEELYLASKYIFYNYIYTKSDHDFLLEVAQNPPSSNYLLKP